MIARMKHLFQKAAEGMTKVAQAVQKDLGSVATSIQSTFSELATPVAALFGVSVLENLFGIKQQAPQPT